MGRARFGDLVVNAAGEEIVVAQGKRGNQGGDIGGLGHGRVAVDDGWEDGAAFDGTHALVRVDEHHA